MYQQALIRPEMRRAFVAYLGTSAVGHLAWEVLQLPLYTIGDGAQLGQQVFAIIHCTAGDLLIAASCLLVALAATGAHNWPISHLRRVSSAILLFGIAYTAFSEWLNVYVWGSWAYSPAMPLVPLGPIAIGLSPLLQWVIVPATALWAVNRANAKPTDR